MDTELGWDLPICSTCAVQYGEDADRELCPICADERQYLKPTGQQWTSLRDMAADGYHSDVREEVPGLWGVGTEPGFAIGQRALLVPGEGGNVLWDCTPYIDERTVAEVDARGGVAAIALSHPHFFSTISDWSRAFGGVPIYVHARDAGWLGRTDGVELWTGDAVEVLAGRTMINLGVHFAGGSVLHWDGVDGRGALCTGDIVNVVADRQWVSFMYSFPNLIPEHPDTIAHALDLLQDYRYDSVYSAWWDTVMAGDAKANVIRSAHRYFTHIGADRARLPPLPDTP